MVKKWIQAAKIKKGALHQELGIPQGKKIPSSLINSRIATLERQSAGDKKLPAAKLRLLRRLRLAKTFKSMNK